MPSFPPTTPLLTFFLILSLSASCPLMPQQPALTPLVSFFLISDFSLSAFTSLSNVSNPHPSLCCKMFPPQVSSEIKVYHPFYSSYSLPTHFLLFSTKRFLLLHCTLDSMVEGTPRPPDRQLRRRRLR